MTLYDKLFEGMEYKALEGMVKPMIHIDEFQSKMADDDEVMVLSFYVRDAQAARDLEHWFETGYPEVLDADTSPGELKPNRYLVYVEIRRRSNAGKIAARLLDDLESVTEFTPGDWSIKYEEETFPWSRETFEEIIPLSPQAYREKHPEEGEEDLDREEEQELNEWRVAAGLDAKPLYGKVDADLHPLQVAAGIR